MADHVTLPGTGAVVASDDIGGAQHQLVKIEFGADNSATMVSTGSPLPVVQTGALPAGGNNIGDVDVLTLPALPAGANAIGTVGVTAVTPGTGATALGKAEDAVHASGDTGVMALAVRRDTPAAGAADGDYAAMSVDDVGQLRVNVGAGSVTASGTVGWEPSAAATAARATVNDTATSTTLLASSATRRGFVIVNTSSAVLYVAFGGTASATNHIKALAQGESVGDAGPGVYTGDIVGVWASDPNDGVAVVTSW